MRIKFPILSECEVPPDCHLFPGPPCPEVVVPVWVKSMDQIKLFVNYSYSIAMKYRLFVSIIFIWSYNCLLRIIIGYFKFCVNNGNNYLKPTRSLASWVEFSPNVRKKKQSSISGRVIPKTQKKVLNVALLSTQHYKVRIKGKVEQPREWSSALPYTSV